MYKTVVVASLQYGCETWTLYGKQLKTIDQFILRCLHKIMDISWEDKPSNTEVLRRANIPGTEALIVKAQLQWVGRVVRMDDARLPKMVFFDLTTCARNIGRPLKRLKDGLKASLGLCISPNLGWETLVTDRIAWKIAIHKGVQGFEEKRLHDLAQKRQARKERRPDPATATACPPSVVTSVRPTAGCVFTYGVTDVFIVEDGLP